MNTPTPAFACGARRLSLLIAAALWGAVCHTAALKGRAVDGSSGETLVGAIVQAVAADDTTRKVATAASADGSFVFENLPPQTYTLKISYLGYHPYSKRVALPAQGLDAGKIALQRSDRELESVEVSGVAVRASQRGDTTEFNADAYKVTQDASTEDLIKKMPGISVEGGTVKTQGEDVKKVLVDGKPFFGDDPTVAIRNLPAELVEKIEVFDRLSDIAQFTGFDDGNAVKTMNIVTRPNRRMGQFGRLYGGAGYDDTQNKGRWSLGGNVNLFSPQRRISIVAMSNNVNQQNFAMEDLSAMQGGGGGGRGGGRFFSFMGNGIATTHAMGVNYGDKWGKNTDVTGSYFFNYYDRQTERDITRTYLQRLDSAQQQYTEVSEGGSVNQNHRLNMRIDHKFTEKTSLLIEPAASFSLNNTDNNSANAMFLDNRVSNNANNHSTSSGHNLNARLNLLLRHGFAKKGRTLAFEMEGSLTDNNTEGTANNSDTTFSYNPPNPPAFTADGINQKSDNPVRNWSAHTEVSYTEPIGEHSLIQAQYEVNYSYGESNKRTLDWVEAIRAYDKLDSLYSNVYSNNYFTLRPEVSYRYRTEKMNASAGVIFQQAFLSGYRTLPIAPNTSRAFYSWLPSVRIEYNFSKHQSLRLNYRLRTNVPSLGQLQDVINNSNPLLLSSGNPHLDELKNHSLWARYNQTSLDKGLTFFAMLSGNAINNYITNATATARRDTILRSNTGDTIWLRQGAQFSHPINLNGYYSVRAVINLGIPVSVLKSNLNITSMAAYSRQPGLVNGVLVDGRIDEGDINYANDLSFNMGLSLGSNISENLDFQIGYNATYNNAINTLQSSQDNTYFRHNANARITWVIWRGITLYSAAAYDQYRYLSSGTQNEYLKWDAGIGKKFLNNRAELKLMVYDITNNANNYSRSVTERYIEDAYSNVLSRYIMCSFTYTLRSFGTPPARREGEGERRMMYRSGGGAPPM